MPELRTTSSTGGQKGVKLERHDLIPAGPLKLLAEHFGKGAMKYDEHQWRQGYEWSKSYSAKQRHDNAWLAGFDYDICKNEPDNCAVKLRDDTVVLYNLHDAEFVQDPRGLFLRIHGMAYDPVHPLIPGETCYNHTGSHHLVASAWHAFVLLEFKDTHPEHDDRYIPTKSEKDNNA